ncbi:immunity 8 family protein [Wielerella bovis]|uniref:Imm8 family immunity protein n=1 Tax=Wielerella bovis TaxID=2917790 RepID=UPI0020190A55|nr:Imm8 family immunity protein [Wielerella bovis]ULJ68909.1 immunity 8 family protein [Wielerella bovis]
MLIPELKKISCLDYDLTEFPPEIRDNFCILLILKIGFAGKTSMDTFNVAVCSPKWLAHHLDKPQSGRHMIIIQSFDFPELLILIKRILNQCQAETESLAIQKITRYFAWELEDTSSLCYPYFYF